MNPRLLAVAVLAVALQSVPAALRAEWIDETTKDQVVATIRHLQILQPLVTQLRFQKDPQAPHIYDSSQGGKVFLPGVTQYARRLCVRGTNCEAFVEIVVTNYTQPANREFVPEGQMAVRTYLHLPRALSRGLDLDLDSEAGRAPVKNWYAVKNEELLAFVSNLEKQAKAKWDATEEAK